jgi:hypothetical protein
MTEDINYLIKEYWDNLLMEAESRADQEAENFISKLNLPNSCKERILVLSRHLNKLTQEAEKLSHFTFTHHYNKAEDLFSYTHNTFSAKRHSNYKRLLHFYSKAKAH